MKKLTRIVFLVVGILITVVIVKSIVEGRGQNSKSNTLMETSQSTLSIPYGDNYTVSGCIKKFHTLENFEKSI